jgi:hypothetical protein
MYLRVQLRASSPTYMIVDNIAGIGGRTCKCGRFHNPGGEPTNAR